MPVFDVTIVGKAYLPDAGQGLPGQPPRPWGPVFYPDQGLPIPQPGQPPRPWGPINYPDQSLPGNQPGLWPIRPPYVDIGFPGPQPGQPPRPWGPINYPDQGLPPIVVPPQIWGGGNEPFPNPPVYIPIPPPGSTNVPSQPVNEPPTDSPYWMQVFLPNVGWVWAIVPKPPEGGGEGSTSNP